MRAVSFVLAPLVALGVSALGYLASGPGGAVTGFILGIALAFLLSLRFNERRSRALAAHHEAEFSERMRRAFGADEPLPPDRHPKAPWLRVVPARLTVELPDVIRRIQTRARRDLPGALQEAERLLAKHPNAAAVHRLQAVLHMKAGFKHRALASAGHAIRLAFHRGDTPEALEAYRACQPWRDELDLDAATLQRLARLLVYRDDSEGAAWALDRAARLPRKDAAPPPG